MDGVDQAILGVAGFLAVTSLVRMMIQRRDHLVARFRQQLADEKRRLENEKRKQSQQKKAA